MTSFHSNATFVEFKFELKTIVSQKFNGKIIILCEQESLGFSFMCSSIVTLCNVSDYTMCYRFPPDLSSSYSSIFDSSDASLKWSCEQEAAKIAIRTLDQAVLDFPGAFGISNTIVQEDRDDNIASEVDALDWSLKSVEGDTSVPEDVDLDLQIPRIIISRNFKGDLQEHYAKNFKNVNAQISYAVSSNQQGLFISVVSISIIDNEANIRTFTGLPRKTKKLSEHSAAKIALSNIKELSNHGFVDPLNNPSLLVNIPRNPQNPIGASSSILKKLPRNLEIGGTSSLSKGQQQSNNIPMDEPSYPISPYNTEIDLKNMLNLFSPKTMSPSVSIPRGPTMVHTTSSNVRMPSGINASVPIIGKIDPGLNALNVNATTNFKNMLQEHYAKVKGQPCSISYALSSDTQGPPFESEVSIVLNYDVENVKAYYGLPRSTKKGSEQSAAETAWQDISAGIDVSAPIEGMVDQDSFASNLNASKGFKNVLQEYYAKLGKPNPSYSTIEHDQGLFVSTVSIQVIGDKGKVKVYTSLPFPTKKASEQSAAKNAIVTMVLDSVDYFN